MSGADTRVLLLSVATTVGAVTIVTLTSLQREPLRPLPTDAGQVERTAPSARAYRELRDRPETSFLDAQTPAFLNYSSELASDAARQQAIDRRAAGRAYEGAPPTIPHAIQDRRYDCAACHQRGSEVVGKWAPAMSHYPMANCTQCHVPRDGSGPRSGNGLRTENDFARVEPPLRGSRAWNGAPPTIPHSLHLRTECNSCHGPHGLVGLRGPHPERSSCTQCHVPAQENEARGEASLR